MSYSANIHLRNVQISSYSYMCELICTVVLHAIIHPESVLMVLDRWDISLVCLDDGIFIFVQMFANSINTNQIF